MAARTRRGGDRRPRSQRFPRWLTPALAGWIILWAVAMANATAVPVRADVVVALIALLAVAHGRVHGRWRVAGPVVVVAAITFIASASGALPVDAHTTWSGGPAGSTAPRVIWVAAVIIAGVDIGWGLRLHARGLAAAQRRAAAGEPALEPQLVHAEQQVRARLGDLDAHVTAVEDLLTTVP